MAKDRERFPPNNILLTLAGAGLLWMGWSGFNGGAPYAANIDASLAVLNTHVCTATLCGQHRYIGLAYAMKDGRLTAGFRQIGIQFAGILFILILNVVVTSVICVLVRLVVPLRLSEEEMLVGDDAIHGEDAYAVWGDGETFENSVHSAEQYSHALRGVEMI